MEKLCRILVSVYHASFFVCDIYQEGPLRYMGGCAMNIIMECHTLATQANKIINVIVLANCAAPNKKLFGLMVHHMSLS